MHTSHETDADSETARNQSDTHEGRDTPDYRRRKVSIRGSAVDTVGRLLRTPCKDPRYLSIGNQTHDCCADRSQTQVEKRQGYTPCISEKSYYHDCSPTSYGKKKSDVAGRSARTSLTLTKHVTRLLSTTGDRLGKWSSYAIPLQSASGRIQGLTPNPNEKDDEEKTTFHTSQGVSIAIQDAFWPKECGGHLPATVDNASDVKRTDTGGFSHRKTRKPNAGTPQERSKTPKTHGSNSTDGSTNNEANTNLITDYALQPEWCTNLSNVDSRLVSQPLLGEYVGKQDNMIHYLDKTKSLIQGFDRFTIRQVPRGDNKKADALSKIASTSFAHLSKQVLVEILKNKSISGNGDIYVERRQEPTG
ncbi:reverse transcriptase domain-containing protein [Tanacetum coccineum]